MPVAREVADKAEGFVYPKGISLAQDAKLVQPGQLSDGSVNMEDVLAGRITKRYSADAGQRNKPAAGLLICPCGHIQRVVFDGAPEFRCEGPGCDITWYIERIDRGVNERGKPVWEIVRCKHDDNSGVCDHHAVYPFSHEEGLPIIKGKYRRSRVARKA